ncbi:hypothetical protein MTR_7g099120 [Medicago truncatula]|uniref:Uncharacterized protein n=1 Tax=Medicago truncatula TaxID=3880 RepID=G7KYJ1_MEDTR|nr:hypothetical protein MTR_7g099120 [Medicago truncatula]
MKFLYWENGVLQIPFRGRGCGTRSAADQLVGDTREGLGYKLNMELSLGLENFELMEDVHNDWGNTVLSAANLTKNLCRARAPLYYHPPLAVRPSSYNSSHEINCTDCDHR